MFSEQNLQLSELLSTINSCNRAINLLRIEITAHEFNRQFLEYVALATDKLSISLTLLKELEKLKIATNKLSAFGQTVQIYLQDITDKIKRNGRISPRLWDELKSRLVSCRRDLDAALKESYTHRSTLWGDHIFTTTHFHTTVDSLKILLAKADHATDKIIMDINHLDNVTTEQFVSYTKQLNDILQVCKAAIEAYLQSETWYQQRQEFLQDFWQEDYPESCSLQHKIFYLINWYDYLTRTTQNLCSHYSTESFHFQLAIKRLLTNTRNLHYMEFCKHPKNIHLVEDALLKKIFASALESTKQQADLPSCSKNVQMLILDQLKMEVTAWQEKITTLEQNLQKIPLTQKIIVSGISLWTESYYYRLAESYFQFINELSESPQFRDIPLLNTKLEPDYLSFFTALGSIMLVGIDRVFIGFNGVSCTLINALNQYFLDNIISMIQFGRKSYLNAKQLSPILLVAKSAISFGMYLGIYSLLSGFSLDKMGLLTFGYLTASGFSKFTGLLLDKFHDAPPTETKNSPTAATTGYQLFVKNPLQHIAGIIGYKTGFYAYAHASPFFRTIPPPTSEEILSDPKLCLANKDKCSELALTELGLPKDATAPQIKSRYHELVFAFHPDKNKNPTSHSRILALNRARTRLKELQIRHESGCDMPDINDHENKGDLFLSK